MQQQMSVVTLGVRDLEASKAFYAQGFGWAPVFENGEVAFYQMNGFVLGTWLQGKLAEDMQRSGNALKGFFALAHNVACEAEVQILIDRLAAHGGRALRRGDAPPHGGFRGYVEDPDGHAWEIAFNPAWKIDADGHVTFGA